MNKTEQIYMRHTRAVHLGVDALEKDAKELEKELRDAVDALDEAAARLAEAQIQCEHTMASARELNMEDINDELEVYDRQLQELAQDADTMYSQTDKIYDAIKKLL